MKKSRIRSIAAALKKIRAWLVEQDIETDIASELLGDLIDELLEMSSEQ